jgi:hypothetical protein
MGETGNASGDLWPPLARKDGSFGMIRSLPSCWVAISVASLANPSQTPKTTGARAKRIKLGLSPKGKERQRLTGKSPASAGPNPPPPSHRIIKRGGRHKSGAAALAHLPPETRNRGGEPDGCKDGGAHPPRDETSTSTRKPEKGRKRREPRAHLALVAVDLVAAGHGGGRRAPLG